MIGWIPFVEPMNALQTWWYLLLIPMSFGISMMYRALRDSDYTLYWRSVFVTTGQIVACIAILAVLLGLWVQVVIPLIN